MEIRNNRKEAQNWNGTHREIKMPHLYPVSYIACKWSISSI